MSNYQPIPTQQVADGEGTDSSLRPLAEAMPVWDYAEIVRPRPVPDGRLRTWLEHHVGCDCPDCNYVDAHLDDEADDAGA